MGLVGMAAKYIAEDRIALSGLNESKEFSFLQITMFIISLP